MQKHFNIPIALGDIKGRLIAAGIIDEDNPGDLFLQQHNHTYYELHYVLQGSCVLQTGRESFRIDSGHCFLIPPEVYHHFKPTGKELRKIDLAFEMDLSEKAAQKSKNGEMSAFPLSCVDLDLHFPGQTVLRDAILYIGTVIREGREATFLGREQLRAMGNVILVQLYAAFSLSDSGKIENDNVDSRVLQIETFIAKHYNDKDNCADLANLLHVSQRQLTRIIRQLYNMSFREKVNEMRLQNAMDLLISTDLSVAEIAERLGYSSASNFSIFVKKQSGKTPSQIRNSH